MQNLLLFSSGVSFLSIHLSSRLSSAHTVEHRYLAMLSSLPSGLLAITDHLSLNHVNRMARTYSGLQVLLNIYLYWHITRDSLAY